MIHGLLAKTFCAGACTIHYPSHGLLKLEGGTDLYVWLTTAGLLIRTHTENQFADELEGLRHFRDHHWKALGGENSDLSDLFL